MWCIKETNTFGLKANREFIKWVGFSIDINPLRGIRRLFLNKLTNDAVCN